MSRSWSGSDPDFEHDTSEEDRPEHGLEVRGRTNRGPARSRHRVVVRRGTKDAVPGRRDLIAIGPSPPPAHGVSVAMRHVLAAMRQHGQLAEHIDTRDPRPVETIGRFDLVNIGLALRHAARLARSLARHRQAAVYLPLSQGTWGFLRDALFILLARAARRPVYVHLHGSFFQQFYSGSPPPLRWLIRATLSGIAQAWVLTPSLAAAFDGLVPEDRIRVLENVVDDPLEARQSGRHDSPQNARSPQGLRILYLSNLIPEKGCFELIRAVAALGERARGWRLRFVGQTDEAVRRELVAWSDRLRTNEIEVELAGALHGAAKDTEYLFADIFVLPTWYPMEGQPLVLLEALAAGLPIVTTAHGGIPETVRDGLDALLVPPKDVPALAQALERLATDEQLRAELGGRARARYEDRYRPPRMHRDVARLLAET